MGILNNFFKKEAPLLGLQGLGGGLGFLAGGSAPIQASGGTTVTFGVYKAHIFENPTSDNFVVNSGSGDIDILVVGGGGAGCGGGSGKCLSWSIESQRWWSWYSDCKDINR